MNILDNYQDNYQDHNQRLKQEKVFSSLSINPRRSQPEQIDRQQKINLRMADLLCLRHIQNTINQTKNYNITFKHNSSFSPFENNVCNGKIQNASLLLRSRLSTETEALLIKRQRAELPAGASVFIVENKIFEREGEQLMLYEQYLRII